MIAKIIIVAWTLFVGYCFMAGIIAVHENHPSDAAFGWIIMFAAVGYLAVWMLVALPTYMISRMFAHKSSEGIQMKRESMENDDEAAVDAVIPQRRRPRMSASS